MLTKTMMTHPLSPREKRAIKASLEESTLYKAFETPIRQMLANEMKTLSCEDVFCVVIGVIDDILEDHARAVFEVRGLWSRLEETYKDIAGDDLPTDVISKYVGITISCVTIFLQYANVGALRDLEFPLANDMERHQMEWKKMYTVVLDNIRRLGSDKYKACVEEYLTSEVYFSDVIADKRKNTDRLEAEELIRSLKDKAAVLAYMAARQEGMMSPLDWNSFNNCFPGVCGKSCFNKWSDLNTLDDKDRQMIETYRRMLKRQQTEPY